MKKILYPIKKNKIKSILLFLTIFLTIYVFIVIYGSFFSSKSLKNQGGLTISSTLISDRNFLNTVKYGSIEDIKNMLELGANPKAVDENSRNAIIIASIFRKDPKIIEVLKNNGVDINHKDINGYNALMFAYISGNSESFINKLIENGADVNAKTLSGVSVLMIALGTSTDIEEIKQLINDGADINYSNNHKVTPLMIALKTSKNKDFIKFLLKKGANPSAKDDLGISTYDIFKTNENLNNDKYIEERLK